MEEDIFFQNSERKKKTIGLIHRVYLTSLKNSKKYLASTKTRSEVRGGGRKPWKQKGTGRARAGSIRTPLWPGGGVIFGPKPRIVKKKINKQERKLAILSAFYLKQKRVIEIENPLFEDQSLKKTKTIVTFLNSLKLKSEHKILFILPKGDKNFWLATKNLKNVETTTANCLNIIQLLKADYIVLPKLSLETINSTYGSK
jgi:large subunit ribosomal protein L4